MWSCSPWGLLVHLYISNWVMVQWFLPFNFEKKEIFNYCSLSPKQLSIFNSNLMYGYVIGICWSSSNLVMVWWYLTWTMKKKWNFLFPFIISPTVIHFQLKFDIKIHLWNKQAKFEFGHGLMILDKGISFECWKIIGNFQFLHSYFCGNVCSHYLCYKYAIWKRLTLNIFMALNFV
jgi:hypothetical protein